MALDTELLKSVTLFAGLDEKEAKKVASLFKERNFSDGEAMAEEGKHGIGFFVIESGEAKVTVHGDERATLGPGSYFGEIALIDDGPRTASVIADTELHCYGLTSWEFRPLVETNAEIAWKLLEGLAKRVRALEAMAG